MEDFFATNSALDQCSSACGLKSRRFSDDPPKIFLSYVSYITRTLQCCEMSETLQATEQRPTCRSEWRISPRLSRVTSQKSLFCCTCLTFCSKVPCYVINKLRHEILQNEVKILTSNSFDIP